MKSVIETMDILSPAIVAIGWYLMLLYMGLTTKIGG